MSGRRAERIGDLGRRGAQCRSSDDAVLFQFTELRGENLALTPRRRLRSSAKRRGPKERCQTAWTFHLPLRTLMVA